MKFKINRDHFSNGLAQVLTTQLATDPAAAAQWISKLPPGASQIEAAGTLATVWASSDIEAAVAWSSTISDPSLKGTIVSHLGTTWGAIEPDQAIAWLDTLPSDVASQGITGAFNSCRRGLFELVQTPQQTGGDAQVQEVPGQAIDEGRMIGAGEVKYLA